MQALQSLPLLMKAAKTQTNGLLQRASPRKDQFSGVSRAPPKLARTLKSTLLQRGERESGRERRDARNQTERGESDVANAIWHRSGLKAHNARTRSIRGRIAFRERPHKLVVLDNAVLFEVPRLHDVLNQLAVVFVPEEVAEVLHCDDSRIVHVKTVECLRDGNLTFQEPG